MPVARVRTVFTGVAGAPYYNNLHFLNVVTNADAQAVVDRVDTAWTTLSTIMAGALLGAIEAEVPLIDETTGDITSVLSTNGGVVDPTSAADPLPWATQGLVRLVTSVFVNGRRVRGRIFVPGLTEAASANGVPDANTIASLNNFGTTLLGGTVGDLAIYRRPRPATPTSPAVAGGSNIVDTATAWNQWAQLRSRRD